MFIFDGKDCFEVYNDFVMRINIYFLFMEIVIIEGVTKVTIHQIEIMLNLAYGLTGM